MWWNNKQAAERSRREERLNLLPASQEMRHDVGVWSTHPSRTIPPLHQKLFFHTLTHTCIWFCWPKYPQSIAAQGHLSLLWHSAGALQLSLFSSSWALDELSMVGIGPIFMLAPFFNKDRGFNFSIVAKLTRRIPNGDVGCFLESSPHLPPKHCVTCSLNILYVLRINPDLIKALQCNFLKISFPFHVTKEI